MDPDDEDDDEDEGESSQDEVGDSACADPNAVDVIVSSKTLILRGRPRLRFGGSPIVGVCAVFVVVIVVVAGLGLPVPFCVLRDWPRMRFGCGSSGSMPWNLRGRPGARFSGVRSIAVDVDGCDDRGLVGVGDDCEGLQRGQK